MESISIQTKVIKASTRTDMMDNRLETFYLLLIQTDIIINRMKRSLMILSCNNKKNNQTI